MSVIENSINKTVSDNLVQPSIILTQSFLEEYQKKFEVHLNRIRNIKDSQTSILARLQTVVNSNEKISNMTPRELAKELLKEHDDIYIYKEEKDILNQLETSYKEAYEDINEFRGKFFLPIVYSYAFEYEGHVYEISDLTFKDLSSNIFLSLESRTQKLENVFKLRFKANKALLEELMKKHDNKIQQLDINIEEGSTIWSQLKKIHDQILKKSKKEKIVSKGQFYESYRTILKEYQLDNKKDSLPEPDEEGVLEIFIKARKNNLSWTRGGDVENEQDKFMDASLTSATTLIDTLTQLTTFLKEGSFNKEDISANIAKIFGNQNFGTKTLTAAKEQALQELTKELQETIKLS